MPTPYHIQVTTDILVSTQAGKKLKKLTKHSNTAVALAAAATVAAWKASVTQEVAEQNGSAGAALLCLPRLLMSLVACSSFCMSCLGRLIARLPNPRTLLSHRYMNTIEFIALDTPQPSLLVLGMAVSIAVTVFPVSRYPIISSC